MRKPTVIAIVLAVVAVVGSAWTFWPIERYETQHGTFVKMNRYTGEGCTFMPRDNWGQFPLVCLKNIQKTFPPRMQRRSHNGFFIFESKVKVVDSSANATFVYLKHFPDETLNICVQVIEARTIRELTKRS